MKKLGRFIPTLYLYFDSYLYDETSISLLYAFTAAIFGASATNHSMCSRSHCSHRLKPNYVYYFSA